VYTHPRFLAGSAIQDSHLRRAVVAEGCALDHCTIDRAVVGIRTQVRAGATITNSVLLGADYYDVDEESPGDNPVPLGVGMDSTLDKVIVDKNARIGKGVRLVNERGLQEADGENYYIRSGVIIVPKGAVVPDGTIV
jgi:glucose-1-phosphate adenylyltransferase